MVGCGAAIVVRGASEGPLLGVDVEIPLGRLTCLVGPAGGGARTLAADVLCAESRRRYMEALAPLERRGLEAMGRVTVDSIGGLPPAMYFGPSPPTPTQSVAQFLQVDEVLAGLVRRCGQLLCPTCGGLCRSFDEEEAVAEALGKWPGQTVLVLAPLLLETESIRAGVLDQIQRAGFVRLRVDGALVRAAEAEPANWGEAQVEVVVDRLDLVASRRVRLLEAVRNARAISRGRTWIAGAEGQLMALDQDPTCRDCGAVFGADDEGDRPGPRAALAGQGQDDLENMPSKALSAFLAVHAGADPLSPSLSAPLSSMDRLGLGHLELGRGLQAVSRGEYQRLLLIRCVSSGLVGLLYVFEELEAALAGTAAGAVIDLLDQLVRQGNTVLVLGWSEPLLAAAAGIVAFAEGRIIPFARPTDLRSMHRSTKTDQGAGQVRLTGPACPPLAHLDLAFPLYRLVCITGPMGVGKTRLVGQILAPGLRGERSAAGTKLVLEGARSLRRVVELGGGQMGGEQTLAAELGLMPALGRLYAGGPAASQRGYGPEWFMLDRAGGRCGTCAGRGVLQHELEYLEDLEEVCPTCRGHRFRDEVLEITVRGLHLADILALTIDQALDHFRRESRLRNPLEAAQTCGLGQRSLGLPSWRLEPGEFLRLRLAAELVRASQRDVVLIDEAGTGSHPADLAPLLAGLDGLVHKGVSVVLATRHPALLQAADWWGELGPEGTWCRSGEGDGGDRGAEEDSLY